MQNYLILGLGKSGISAANLLISRGANVYAYDKNKSLLPELRDAKLLSDKVTPVGKLSKKRLFSFGIECIIISPGFVLTQKVAKIIQKLDITVMSEVDFASTLCTAPIFAVSGTNGKTTTVNFLHQIFSSCGVDSRLVGNVGVPFCDEVSDTSPKTKFVLELSSFQLEHCEHLRCDAVALLNVARDHLDRYNSFREYYEAKKHLLYCVKPEGKIFLNFDDDLVRQLGQNRQNVYYFSTQPLPREVKGFFLHDNTIFSQKDGEIKPVVSLDRCPLVGMHNYSNLVCAVAMAKFARFGHEKLEQAIGALKTPPHRLEFVGEKNGVRFVDDSKATNIHSTIHAIACFDNIDLMLGGSDKGEDFSEFLSNLPSAVKRVVAFGKTGKKIYTLGKKCGLDIHYCANLIEAFDYVKTVAVAGEVVLLSPACASFDEFSSYAERGESFCRLVAEWLGEK